MAIRAFIGLGNPGPEYSNTRHNLGFMILDELARKFGEEIGARRFSGVVGDIRIGEEKVSLLKPPTLMNRSGDSVSQFLRYFKIRPENSLVIHDDLDLPVGRLKLVRKGGAGGHKGVKSIIEVLGTENFARLKVGIGRPRFGENIEKFVLSPFYPDEREVIEKVIDVAVDGLVMTIEKGLDRAMNVINSYKLVEV